MFIRLTKSKYWPKGIFLARILLFKVYWRLQLVKTVAWNGCVFLLTSLVYFLELFFSLLQIVVEYSLLPFLTDNFTWKIMDKRKLVTIIKWPFSKCKPDSLWIPAFSLYWYILKKRIVTNIIYKYVIKIRFCWLHLTYFA